MCVKEADLQMNATVDLMKAHRWVRQVEGNELSERETLPVIEAISAAVYG